MCLRASSRVMRCLLMVRGGGRRRARPAMSGARSCRTGRRGTGRPGRGGRRTGGRRGGTGSGSCRSPGRPPGRGGWRGGPGPGFWSPVLLGSGLRVPEQVSERPVGCGLASWRLAADEVHGTALARKLPVQLPLVSADGGRGGLQHVPGYAVIVFVVFAFGAGQDQRGTADGFGRDGHVILLVAVAYASRHARVRRQDSQVT